MDPQAPRRQSDYNVIQPIKSIAVSKRVISTAAAPSGSAPVAAAAPHTPERKPTEKKNKLLCDTPPNRLYDSKDKERYKRSHQLGVGGFARCFLVQNKDGEYYASKTVSKKSLAKEKIRMKFLGELNVHKAMDHPNIVKFIECFEDGANIYVILELCSNKSLMDMVKKRGRLTEPEARFFMIQILGAVKYMHSKRVIHRDLKLGNIFLDADMNVKIGDFGLAAMLLKDTDRKKTICGTPNYIAPEVLFGSEEGHGFEVDLWSVGVILYAMLVGKPPFQSKDLDSIYKKIKRATYEWPPNLEVSDSAKDLVRSLLNRDPAARPSLDEIANHAFFKEGLFPRSLPSEARKVMPKRADLSRPTGDRRPAFYVVAERAGIGLNEDGKKFPCVGGKGGLIPKSQEPRRKTAAEAFSESEKENIGGKVKNDRVELLKGNDPKPMLPEALSPRDHHARMRVNKVLLEDNMPAMPTLPQSRASSSASTAPPRRPAARKVVDRDRDSGTESEHGTAPVASAVGRVMPQNLAPLYQPRRPAALSTRTAPSAPTASTNSTAPTAEERKEVPIREYRPSAREYRPTTRRTAASASTATSSSAQEAPSNQMAQMSLREAPAREAPKREPSIRRTRSTSHATRSTRGTTSSDTVPAPKEADAAPAPPSRNSRVPILLDATRTTAIVSQMNSLELQLNAILTGASSPKVPQYILSKVRASRKKEGNDEVFVTSWVDFSNQCGIGYRLSNGHVATLFNDWTNFALENVETNDGVPGSGRRAVYSTCNYVEGSGLRGPSSETVWKRWDCTVRGILHDPEEWEKVINEGRAENNSKAPKTARKLESDVGSKKAIEGKVRMWKKLSDYMLQKLDSGDPWNLKGEERAKRSSEGTFLMEYRKSRGINVFLLSNGTIQMNFPDHYKMVFTDAGRVVRLLTPEKTQHIFTLDELEASISKSDAFIISRKIEDKMDSAVAVLHEWRGNLEKECKGK